MREELEYLSPSGYTIELGLPNDKEPRYYVACWNEDGSNRWLLYFQTREAADVEFNRWRT